jgi:hypothetical protein
MSDHDRIFEKLNEMNEKLSGLCATCPAREKRLDDLEKRVRENEAFQNKAVGIVSIVSLIIGSIGAIITSIIKKGLAQ